MYKKFFSYIFGSNFRLLILFSLMSIFPLVIVYILQYFGVEPCKLCIYQRIPYFIIAVLPIFFLIRRDKSIYGLFIVLIAILSNVALSFFHLGIENKWFENKLCTGMMTEGGSFENMFLSVETLFHRCDEVKFRFLGVSLTGWNFVYCVFFFILVQIAVVMHFIRHKKDHKVMN